ncbi:MAG: uroporphyrinogen decarboxylase family protein [Planctomycetota bacterium]
MLTRRERLMRTLRGEAVDRPAVCFYEINGLDERPDDTDPFNIYTHPSWRPVIDLARERTDRIVMRSVPWRIEEPDPLGGLVTDTVEVRDGSRFVTRSIRAGERMLIQRTRRDADVDTVWTLEHLLKDVDDLKAYLQLPPAAVAGHPDTTGVPAAEAALGETGIVLIDTPDPLCLAAALFDLGEYTVVAMTEPDLFRRLLDRFAAILLPRTEAVAEALPGRLWRIFGPEYATAPYLPPELFEAYVCTYVRPMIDAIHRTGGFARIHCHGNLAGVLDRIVAMGADGIDPIEPPPQGDVLLRDVRSRYGKQLVLFGNLEISDLENLPPDQFVHTVRRALDDGTAADGRGFVLMPSAAPYGRVLSERTRKNYEIMVELGTGG